MTFTDFFGVIFAVIFGAAIGLERELSGKAAGLRTNVLICLGAAVFTIISRQMGLAANQSLTRIAAPIVTGVGFLGAGAIIQDRGGVHGLRRKIISLGGHLDSRCDCRPDRPWTTGKTHRAL